MSAQWAARSAQNKRVSLCALPTAHCALLITHHAPATGLAYCFALHCTCRKESAESRRKRLQYTIEARELSGLSTPQHTSAESGTRVTLDARDEDDAITKFVHSHQSELMSFTAVRGRESIATVKKNDSVYLVRVYTA